MYSQRKGDRTRANYKHNTNVNSGKDGLRMQKPKSYITVEKDIETKDGEIDIYIYLKNIKMFSFLLHVLNMP